MAFLFICNVCNAPVEGIAFNDLEREGGNCRSCGSTVRIRSFAHLLSSVLFNRSLPIPTWPDRRGVIGIGVSDWYRFEEFLPPKISYRNTHYHCEPFLDITKPSFMYRGTADVVMCSDVLEHVPPPAQLGFDGLYSLLRPGGALIFSVPYGLEYTQEHFPELHSWKLEQSDHGPILTNRTKAGELQTFKNLVFHGGEGQVLEMRVFGLKDIMRHLQEAGFTDVRVMEEDVPEYGINSTKHPWSLPIVARRPYEKQWYFSTILRRCKAMCRRG